MARKKKKKTLKAKVGQIVDANPEEFHNREISWLEFNNRVLHEAIDERTPLLERLRFISIFSSNLDEFIMKRVGGIRRLVGANISVKSIDGKSASEQLDLINGHVNKDLEMLHDAFIKVEKKLNHEGIYLDTWKGLSSSDKSKLNSYFQDNIYPVLTPLLVDPGHPFPFISNLSISLAVVLKHPLRGTRHFSRIKVPEFLPYWVKIEDDKNDRFIKIDEVITHNLEHLFPGMEIESISPFKVTRNADVDTDDDEADDLLELAEESLKERKFAECVRLEVPKGTDSSIVSFLISSLELTKDDVYYLKGKILDYSKFKEVLKLDKPKLKYHTWIPRIPRDLEDEMANIFDVISQKDILVHHPYESFSRSVEYFISAAADDPNVLAIKMTLYRTGDKSPFIDALKRAAEKGKQVVCLVELKARFDEQRNIHWANELENAGVHVVYGLVGLKTHSKISLVIRKEKKKFKSYAHIGTGNYHSQTSNLYTDMGLLTCNKTICSEIIEVFNYLTGISLKTDYKKLLLAPINMKSTFIKLISRETKNALADKPSMIMGKMNQLEDVNLIQALYEASKAGVKIILFIRGFCTLKAGIKGLSENITVISVIGRFLEHSRIFYFANGKEELDAGEYYIGSADWMHRNLHKRVEVITPILDDNLKTQIADHLKVLIGDNRQAWLMNIDGTYTQRKPKGNSIAGTHKVMMEKYKNHEYSVKKLF